MLKRTTTLLLFALATCARSEDRFGTLYQPLIDRFPFGKPDPGEYDESGNWIGKGGGPDSVPAAEQEKALSEREAELQKSVSATLLNRDPVTSCLQVGFTDLSNAQSPRPHLVAVGSSEDGWFVKAVDEGSKTVTFVKDEVEVSVVIGAATAPAPKANGKTPVGRPVNSRAQGGRSPLIAGPRGEAGAQESPNSMRSLRQQRHERELARQREMEEDRKARDEELARQREELARQREEEQARVEAERAADREEYKARLNDLAAQLEQKMAEKRDSGSGEDGEEEDDDD